MSKSVVSTLRFEEIFVDQIQFNRNLSYQHMENSDLDLSFRFNSEVSIADTRDRAIIILTCMIFEDNDIATENLPFSLKLSMRGEFACSVDVDIKTFQLNAMAIVLPYLRAQVTSLTAQAGIPPVILPPINVANYFAEDAE